MDIEKLEPRITMLEKELEAAGEQMEAAKINLMADIESLRIDVLAIRRFIAQNHPDMVKVLDGIRDEVAREIGSGKGGA